MSADNDSFDSSDFSEDLVDDEFSNENAVRNRADEREESILFIFLKMIGEIDV